MSFVYNLQIWLFGCPRFLCKFVNCKPYFSDFPSDLFRHQSFPWFESQFLSFSVAFVPTIVVRTRRAHVPTMSRLPVVRDVSNGQRKRSVHDNKQGCWKKHRRSEQKNPTWDFVPGLRCVNILQICKQPYKFVNVQICKVNTQTVRRSPALLRFRVFIDILHFTIYNLQICKYRGQPIIHQKVVLIMVITEFNLVIPTAEFGLHTHITSELYVE